MALTDNLEMLFLN